MVFQFTWTMLTSDTEVWITNDLERNLEVDFTDAYIQIKNRTWKKVERLKASATGGVLTTSKRWLDQSDSDVEVPELKQQWNEWSIAYVTILSSQLVDRQADNTFLWTQTVEWNFAMWTTDTTKYGVKLKALTTTQRNALSSPPDWTIILNTTTWAIEAKVGWSFQWLGAWATTPNMTTDITGKWRLADQTQVNNWTATEAWDPLVVWPAELKVITDAITANILSNVIVPAYFGNGSDGDVTISSWTTTLTRDMYYNNLTITSPWVLDPAWYRIFVKWTLSWTWTIRRNWNNWTAGGTRPTGNNPWVAWAVLNQWSLNMERAWGNGWARSTWAANSWASGASSSPSMTNINGVAWGNNWSWGWAWSAWTATRWSLYNVYWYPQSMHLATASTTFAGLQYLSIPWSWGWAWSAGSWWSNQWAWGWAWGNGWFIWLACYTFNFTWTVSATGWTWWAWGTSAWWWGWGNGWIFFRVYHTLSNDCTKTLTWWSWWAWWAAWILPAGSPWSTGNAWETISIVI